MTGVAPDPPRRFGRALHLSRTARAAELLCDLAYRGGWAPRLARRLGLVGTFGVAEHTFALPGRRAGAPPLRIAFASDLHAGTGTHPEILRQACRALVDLRADLVLLGGDFVSFHARYIDELLPLLEPVAAPFGVWAVLGNHDLMADDAYITTRLESAGVRMLVNANVRLQPPHDDIWVCGLDDSDQGAPDAGAAFAGARGARILLMHSPDGLSALGHDHDFGIALCGHVHGGQFFLRGRPVIHFRGPLSRKYIKAGVFSAGPGGQRPLLVSRGIGAGSLPMRRRADPQIHVCTLTAKELDDPGADN